MKWFAGKKGALPSSRLGHVLSTLPSSQLYAHLQRHTNNLANAVRLYESAADPTALDVVREDAKTVLALTEELLTRTDHSGYRPPPLDPHLSRLLAEFNERHPAHSPSSSSGSNPQKWSPSLTEQ